MSDSIGQSVTLTLFGESHGPAIGCVLQGVAPGVRLDEAFLCAQMDKRRAKGAISTARHEADAVRILSGLYQGRATGGAITFLIENADTRSADYAKTRHLARPGHADYTAQVKYGGFQDARGGGHFSGRLTAPIVAAGSVFVHLLREKGVLIGTHLAQCANVRDASFSTDPAALRAELSALNQADFAVLDASAGAAMQAAIEKAASEGDSVGGVLETAVCGLPAGLGEPAMQSAESVLSALLFSLPAVKGVEFGGGFSLAGLRGSEANDPLFCAEGAVRTATNHNGGINGGITNGMPLVLRTVIKPTPSIYKPQQTVDLETRQNAVLQISGRHDPCIAHRARVVQDSLVALGLADLCNLAYGPVWQKEETPWNTD